jgi:hypothetical protein
MAAFRQHSDVEPSVQAETFATVEASVMKASGMAMVIFILNYGYE